MIQRVVIDSNMLQSEALREFFESSPGHFAVLPDYLWFEIYKQESIEALNSAFSVIRDYPDRLLGLRPSSELALLDPSSPDMVEQMLYPDVPELMRLTFEAVAQANQGDTNVLRQLRDHWSRASSHGQRTMEGAAYIIESLPEVQAIFTAAELKICRTRSKYTVEMGEKIFGAADQIYEYTISEHPYLSTIPIPERRYDTYFYRHALSIMIYLLWWIEKGSPPLQRLDRARNDMVDLSFAIYGTYFDGLLTDDAKAHWMYSNLFVALKAVGARHGIVATGLG